MSALGGADIVIPGTEFLLEYFQQEHHPIIQTQGKLLPRLKVVDQLNLAAGAHSGCFHLKIELKEAADIKSI